MHNEGSQSFLHSVSPRLRIGELVLSVKPVVSCSLVFMPAKIRSFSDTTKHIGYRIQKYSFFRNGDMLGRNSKYRIYLILYNIIYYIKSYKEVDKGKGARFKNCILYSVSQKTCLDPDQIQRAFLRTLLAKKIARFK